MKVLKKYKGLFFTFLFCFVLPFISFMLINQFVLSSQNTFDENYTICGVDIGGLTLAQAEEKFKNYFEIENNEIQLEIKYQDKSWFFNNSDFIVKSNIHTVLETAYKSNHKTNYLNRLKNINKINKMGFSPQIALNYALIDIDDKIDAICLSVEKEPINSLINFNTTTRKFDISESKKGIKVNKEKLYNDIVSNLNKSNTVKVFLETYNTDPLVTKEHLLKATTKQAEFTTNFSNSNFDRKNNIKIASKSLDGFCLLPNEEFSFNNAIGQRSLEKGYKQANIIKDGEFVKGVGGGVCQVSTTLYNALLLANIDVTEVHKHSLPIGYVKPGLDAMVSWDTADLKFKNTTDLPIFIVSSCNDKSLTFSIYGDTKSKNLEIKTSSEIIKKIPHNGDKILPDLTGMYADKIMFKGEYLRTKYPKDGYEAKAYLEYYIDGKFSHKKQIRHSTYSPQQGIVYEGCEILPEGMTLPKDEKFSTY